MTKISHVIPVGTPSASVLLLVILVALAGCAGTTPDDGTQRAAETTSSPTTPEDGATDTESETPSPVASDVPSFAPSSAPHHLNGSLNWSALEHRHITQLQASGGTEFRLAIETRPGPYDADTQWEPDAHIRTQLTNWEAGRSHRTVDYVEGSIDRLELFNTPDARYSTAVVSHNGETRTQYVKDADLTDDELPGLTSPTSRYAATGATPLFHEGSALVTSNWTYVSTATMSGKTLAHYRVVPSGRIHSGDVFISEDGIVHKFTVTFTHSQRETIIERTVVVFDGPQTVPTPDWTTKATTPAN